MYTQTELCHVQMRVILKKARLFLPLNTVMSFINSTWSWYKQ